MADIPDRPARSDPGSSSLAPILLPPGTGRRLDALAITHRLTGDESSGSIYLFESTFEAGNGNRMHVHTREDEITYVLDGAIEIRVPGRTERLDAGGVGRLPKGLGHAIRNPLDVPSRYLFLAVPAGLDRFFDAVAAALAAGTLDQELYQSLSEDHGLRWLE
jgi:quercetin dioxygenase-like cupin family protein